MGGCPVYFGLLTYAFCRPWRKSSWLFELPAFKKLIEFWYLHSVHSLRGWLALRTSVILPILVYQCVSQGAVGHRMLVHSVLLEIRHHVRKPGLGCRLCSFLLYLVHLLQVFLRHRIQFCPEALLGLQGASLRFGYLINFETTSHSWVHHDLTWSLYFLQTIQSDIVQIARAVQIPLFVAHDLLEEVISTSFSLLSFQEQIVGWCNLIVLVVLDISYSLIQIAIWTDSWSGKAVLDLAEELINHWYSILSNYYALHLEGFHLCVPLVSSNVCYRKSFRRICVQYFSN